MSTVIAANDHDEDINFPSEVSVDEFSSTEDFILSVDIDSLYFGNELLGNVVAALGTRAVFSCDWMINRWSCTNQSRFSVTTRHLDKEILPLRVNRKKPLVVALHRFRNVTLFRARIPNFSNSEIRIHLYWLYSEKLSKNGFFTDVQLVAICFLLNFSLKKAIEEAGNDKEQFRQYQELTHAPILSPHLAGKGGHFYSNKSFQLSYDSMCLWTDKFDNQLLYSSSSSFEQFVTDYKKIKSPGTYFVKKQPELKFLKKVHRFVCLLHNGCHFTATMAGAKSDFINVTDSEYVVPIQRWADESSWYQEVNVESASSNGSNSEREYNLFSL